MFGAIYTGLSGLEAFSAGLQAVSNNVTNLDSTGFKSSSVTFANVANVLDPSTENSGNSQSGTGGGVEQAGSTIDFSAGQMQQTSKALDLAVNGNGFLTVMDGSQIRYLQTGSFEVNSSGYIVLAGTKWQLATLNSSGQPVAVSTSSYNTYPPAATTTVAFTGNLSSSATTDSVSNITVYDANGGAHTWQAALSQSGSTGNWTVTVTDENGNTAGSQTLSFSGGTPTSATSKLTFDDTKESLSVVFDFSSNVTSYSAANASTLATGTIDGNASGTLTGVTVNAQGQVSISYSNSQTKTLGAVAVATFQNPQALVEQSGGMFTAPASAGLTVASTGDPRVGTVEAGYLEASNVNLSAEFGDLIIIQRGYQASSEVVSTANDMLQQLFQIHGHG
ncbi:flagellar hook-basal body complex protein [Telmatospirillum sp.]|uniref:flagellar hook-basal body complex protein n=1 Tax=Telmatospirillum sp. TaxID=2079197 RepID=UPI00284D8815|nr:flagellar hook-basal body complex protein [Telmatospirillum sp.]MDR3438084.1 flagellar hook-basal body complex protein [Telmatospirillum sp.]